MSFLLHIGTHKTGTTSIQKFFRKNQELIENKGLVYPNFNIINKSKRYAHHEIAHALAGKSKNLVYSDAKRFVERCKEKYGESANVLISAEPFYRHYINKSSSQNIWKGKELYIKRVKELFGNDTELIFVFRRQDLFAASLFQENVKVNRYSKKFSSFLKEYSSYFDYYKNVALWQRYFEKIHVFDFDDLASQGPLELNFARKLGYDLDSEEVVSPAKENESFHPDLVEFKRILNGTPLCLETLDRIKGEMLLYNSEFAEAHGKSKSYWIEDAQRKLFLNSYKDSNRKLSEKYLDGDAGNLIDKPLTDSIPVYSGLSESIFTDLVKKFL